LARSAPGAATGVSVTPFQGIVVFVLFLLMTAYLIREATR
jgi:hypothetical protein